eukprot:TRINITY_DN30822_c0_g1_i1.p1 TRINITY_DN30822_c0_g1~~TRINITY_DN30822_c0_g1_i1.p1  ORF type:complete len:307 (+),score=18.51 TRINITY_DN30822_c0_g1_i1:32-952(+)
MTEKRIHLYPSTPSSATSSSAAPYILCTTCNHAVPKTQHGSHFMVCSKTQNSTPIMSRSVCLSYTQKPRPVPEISQLRAEILNSVTRIIEIDIREQILKRQRNRELATSSLTNNNHSNNSNTNPGSAVTLGSIIRGASQENHPARPRASSSARRNNDRSTAVDRVNGITASLLPPPTPPPPHLPATPQVVVNHQRENVVSPLINNENTQGCQGQMTLGTGTQRELSRRRSVSAARTRANNIITTHPIIASSVAAPPSNNNTHFIRRSQAPNQAMRSSSAPRSNVIERSLTRSIHVNTGYPWVFQST